MVNPDSDTFFMKMRKSDHLRGKIGVQKRLFVRDLSLKEILKVEGIDFKALRVNNFGKRSTCENDSDQTAIPGS